MRQDRHAIVGYGFRLPGGMYTADEFWQLLSQREFVREPAADRYGRGYEPVLGDPGPSRLASTYEGLMRGDEPYLFDSRLFGMSTREASVMDPQMRMLLTCTWEAFERAGWDQARLRNSRTGVFIGAQVSSSGNWRPVHGPNEYIITGTSLDMLPNRISYAFNLMGPSATYMTACSSGATALHAAVTALSSGDCDQAVVGASTFLGSAMASAGFGRLGVISPDGGCRSFDATANGYMRSEGVFVYLVKPLAAAEEDGDRILAVIAGTTVNTAGAADGATGSGPGRMITAPTQHAQAELMRTACERAGLTPYDVAYIEAHATGTRVGDRIEGNAISEVFGGDARTGELRVASVKSNVGHMEAAAFTCALLKVLLMFEHRTYAPISRHFSVPNPDIDFTGLRVQTECEPFGDGAVTVGINSFGFGGANGHCLLTEYRPAHEPARSRPAAPDAGYVIPLSARSPEALRQTARELAATPETDLYTLAGNLSRRRTHFATRTAFAATSMDELRAQLEEFAEPVSTVAEGRDEPAVLMVFAGQGTQWAGCGRELYATEPVFSLAVDDVDKIWRRYAGFSLRDACFSAPQEELDECQLAQPVIFMIEVALVELLKAWGVRPGCVVGHSAGEVAAAYAAGIFSLAEATRLVYHRATLQQRTAGSGRMLAIGLDRAGTEAIVPELEIACENAPASTVVCGTEADVRLATQRLEQRRVQHRLLRGNVAFHSPAMDVIEADLRGKLAFLDDLPLKAEVPFISSVTGERADALNAAYWWSNVRDTVRFMAAIRTAARDYSPDVVIEVAPHSALLTSVRQCWEDSPACVSTLKRGTDSRLSFHAALGALYRAGAGLDFEARYPRVRPIGHLLPAHPRDDRPVMDPTVDDTHFVRQGEYSAGPLLGRRIPGHQPRFEVRMSAADFGWLAEHRVQHTPIMPAAGYVEMILQAVGTVPARFEQVEFLKPCLVTAEPVRLQTDLYPEEGTDGGFSFRISSMPYADGAESIVHCTGKVRSGPAVPGTASLADLDQARFTDDQLGSGEAFYTHMNAVIGEYFQYGPSFQTVRRVRQDTRTKELLIDLRLDEALWRDGQRAGFLLPPALLDGGLQAFLYYLMQCSDISAVPRRMAALTIGRLPTSPRLVCHFVPPDVATLHEMGQLSLPLGERDCGSLTLYDPATGEQVAHLAGYTGFHANPKQDTYARSRYVIRWRPKSVSGSSRVVAFFTQGTLPEPAALADWLGDELWLLGSTAEDTQRLFEEFGGSDAAVRFATADLSDPASVDLSDGLLRPCSVDLIVAGSEEPDLFRRLLVPGGVALIRHQDGDRMWVAPPDLPSDTGAQEPGSLVYFHCDEDDDDPVGERLVRRFLDFMRALVAAREGQSCAPCRVTVVSRRAVFDTRSPRAATLWGAVRALAHELSPALRLDLRLVDIGGPEDLETLSWLGRNDLRERELAIRDGRLYAPRLVRQPGTHATVPAGPDHPYRLSVTSPGQLTGLTMRSVPPRPLGAREVEIEVTAAALNFRDVMVALDLLPLASYEKSALGRQVGMEGSGTIRRVGSQVTSRRVGERVIFMQGGCIANRVIAAEDAVFAQPGTLSAAQAAAVLSVYVTAYYALVDLARLRAGQRVLIHSAMGGVGQAAIALARHAGATVYATAGTEQKRARLLELGVAAAFDSHSFSWYDELLAATDGEGVDVVLNSLAGHHIELCLRALRPGGWHCEIGKVDIYAGSSLGMSVFRKNLRFAAIDVDRLMHDDPAHCRALSAACLELLGDGAVLPPSVMTFDYAEYGRALRFMASGQHEGKLVLLAPEGRELEVVDRRPFLDPAAAYLVTGGLGGIGLRLLGYLVSAGARHLVLMDRDPRRRRDAGWVRHASGIAHFFPDADVRIDIVGGDVACQADVERCVSGLNRPLKGVFHLAAVLEDHLLADVSAESVAAVFGAKARGAWYLHQATSGAPLDHFVMFSSATSVFGNAGQSAYAAANAFLDGLAELRHRLGQPALAYNMAAVAEAGMAARSPHVLRLMKASGMPPVSTALAIANLDFALRAMHGDTHLVGVDIGRQPVTPDSPDYPRVGRWVPNDAALAQAGVAGVTTDSVIRELTREISKLSGHEQVGPRDTIASFGINSLSVAELGAFIKARFNHHVSALDLMTTATPESIATAITGGAPVAADADAVAADAVAADADAAPARDGGLPEQCQADLEFLRNTIRTLLAGESAGQPVPADRFCAVFLTGATGFVGRFVLAELLRRDMVVHCLVRAQSPAEGAERIRQALESAGIWDDGYAARIKAWPGDLREARFGLREQDFARLCDEVDAVYHLAADLNLFSSYQAMRDANTRSFGHVLELALRRRFKHIVYASTMGVFPQYFCNFGGDFSEHGIQDEAQPEAALMRSVFPPELVGYPWSKLVVEQSLLYGRSLGLPVAIMRLPQMGTAASTGYTQSSDIKVRIAMAVLDSGVMPPGFRLQWTEPVDSVSEILTAISLNPDRRHTIYHLCNPAPHDHGLELADFGLETRQVSYPEFRRACQARGPRGPLHGHWALIDHFAPYWFGSAERPSASVANAVTADAVAADAPGAAAWPGLITTMSRSLGWITRQNGAWPYQRPAVSLDAAKLRRQAERFAAQMDVRFDDAYPPVLLEGMDRLVSAIGGPSARVREDRLPAISFELGRKLWNRASLTREYAAEPEIAREQIERPVFILGINRTGTTLLHRVLAQGQRFWALYPHELAHPALPHGRPETARRWYSDDVLAASGIAEAMHGIHWVDASEPEEEFALLEDSFQAWTYTLRYFVPDYASWLATRGGGFGYDVHRRTMQHLSWQRGSRLGIGTKPWLLKMPFHLAELETLAATYPDAVFIQTHREPREFMPSWFSLADSVRSLAAAPEAGGRAAIGREQLAFMSRMLEGAAAARSANPALDQRFLDVSYLDLVEDPARVVTRIYQHFGWTLDDQTQARTQSWLTGQTARRHGQPRHRYSLDAYGVTSGQLDAAFPRYTSFIRDRHLRMSD